MFAVLISHKDRSSFAGNVIPVGMADPRAGAAALAMAVSSPPIPYAGGKFGDTFIYVAM